MIPLKYLLDHKEEVIQRLKVKHFDASEIVKQIEEKNVLRKKTQAETDAKLAELNQISKEIGSLFKQGEKAKAEEQKKYTLELKDQIQELQHQLSDLEKQIDELLVFLPNIPHNSVPEGKGSEDNLVVRQGGVTAEPNNGLPHWDLARKYDIIDFELGNKITGSGFPVYKGKGAKLQRALISFFLDEALKAGYNEVLPPFLVNEDSGFGTGQLPDKEGQMYHVQTDNLFLVPTAEVPVTNIFRDVILNEEDLPQKYTAYSPCFRREAGSYGKDVRGLNRLHQFDKVEIVVIEHPHRSYEQLEQMLLHVEGLVQKLELPYRIVKLCGGDMSFSSALTYDVEVFSMAQNKWLEVSSVSNFENFQANRLKLRYRDKETKKNNLCHTLNGSALALPRIVAAILENFQTEEGIRIPDVLKPYTGFDYIK
ncbi:MAG: serine--tRNA ligase [Bacteroidales bacterium]|nr:serine--tRNA ligase [Bacteroidales bacterium]